MLRPLLALALLLSSGASSFAQLEVKMDWRNTYRLNAVLDGISTYQFRQHGAFELNPLAAPFVNRDRWVEAGLLLVGEMVLIDWVESRLRGKWKGLAYVVGALAHSYCILNNRQYGATMVPIPVLRIRF
jgi:hypothetical protein